MDIKKLMRYTKRGQSAKWFYPQLNTLKKIEKNNTESNKNINNKLNKINKNEIFEMNKTQRPKSNPRFKKVFSPTVTFYSNNNENNNSYQSTMGLTSTTAFSNFRNTIKTVRNEAEKAKFIDENFDKKWDTMENFFKKNELLPKLERNESVKSNISKKISDKDDEKNSYWKRKNRRNILNAFEKTYKEKKLEWKKDEELRELEKKKDEEEKKKIKMYLKEIKNLSRKPQLYIDGYSNRDGKTNERIKQFNKILNGNFYNKTNLNKKLNDFSNKVQYRDREKELYEKELRQHILDEKEKARQNELEYQTCLKIWANLDNEEVGKDIEFNYQVIAGQINTKTEIDPYKEYLEFYNIINEREEEIKKKNIEKLKKQIDHNNKNKKRDFNLGIKKEKEKFEDEKKNEENDIQKDDKILRKRIQIKSQQKNE